MEINKIKKIMIQKVKIDSIFENPTNPRTINKVKFDKLVKSIKTFPEMLSLRPIVVNKEGGIIGGNMRYKACKENGLKEVYVIKADKLTDKQIEQFIIKDNVGFGEWDYDLLSSSWDSTELADWGLDVIKNDWDQLDYIEEEVENKTFEDDGQIIILLSEKHIQNKRKIKDDIADWLEQNYKGSEIK